MMDVNTWSYHSAGMYRRNLDPDAYPTITHLTKLVPRIGKATYVSHWADHHSNSDVCCDQRDSDHSHDGQSKTEYVLDFYNLEW